jgi:hypothetical protein
MNVGAVNILAAAAVGLGATLLRDLWNLFLNRAFRIPSLNCCLLGRWLRHMAGGTFRHANITAAPPRRFECTVGSIAHYSIGVVFAVVFVLFVSGVAASKTPNPTQARLKSVMTHTVFGIGLYVWALGVSYVLRPASGE